MTRLPYPGLRAYTREETDLFFGREGCVNEMIDRLAATRFLAVLGASGSGKSSLVRTGLFDGLELGLYARAGADWLIVDMHPGGRPIHNLAHALLMAAEGAEPEAIDVEAMATYLRQGPLALAEWLEQRRLRDGQNLLVLVDQFEELFRYSSYAGREQAEAFAALLLESKRVKPRLHVAITMRSEYLGACALVPGLAQAINAGLYLTRRMSREECREAIVGPAAVMGFEVEPALVTRILNDLASFAPWSSDREESQIQRLSRQADQLPLMQHALSRLWQVAESHAREGPTRITLADYEAVGELRGALQQHAEEVIAELDGEAKELVRPVFRSLVDGPTLADAVRRPRRFGDIVSITGVDAGKVRQVVDAFRAPGRNFLRPQLPLEISDGSIIDISHESLIRQWESLSGWFEEEAAAASLWARLIGNAARHRRGEGDLLRGLDLANALAWWDREKPTEAWTDGHGGGHEEVAAYLEKSRAAEEAEARAVAAKALRERRGLRVRAAIYAGLAIVAAAAAFYGFFQAREARDQAARAEEQTEIARQERASADELRLRAEELAREADDAARKAEAAAARAEEEALRALRAEARVLSSLARSEALAGRPAEAMKLALAAWPRRRDHGAIQLTEVAESLAFAMSVQAEAAAQGADVTSVRYALFSPDGSRVVAALAAGAAVVFDVESGEVVARLEGQSGEINWAEFSPDGSRVVIGSAGGEVMLFDARTGEQVTRIHWEGVGILGISFSGDGSRYVLAAQSRLTGVYDAETATLIATLEGHDDWIRSAVFSPDGSRVLTASDDGTARIFDAQTAEELLVLRGHTEWVRTAQFSPDGRYVLTGADDHTARIFDAATGRQIAVLTGHTARLATAFFSPDGTRVVTAAYDNTARLHNLAGLLETGRRTDRQRPVEDDKDTGAADTEEAVEVEGSIVLQGHTDWVRTAYFSPDGRRIVTASDDLLAKIYDGFTGRHLLDLQGHGSWLTSAVFSPDGSLVATASLDGSVRLWDPGTGEILSTLSPEGRHDVTAASMRLLTLEGHDGPVNTGRFSPDGKTVVTAGRDSTVRIWDAETGEQLAVLQHQGDVWSATYSPDGRHVLTSTFLPANAALVWDVTGAEPVVVSTLRAGQSMWAAYSPDGSRIVVAGRDGNVTLWDAASGDKLGEFFGHEAAVWTAEFSPDGRIVATAAKDGTARIWDAGTTDLLHLFQIGEPGEELEVYSAQFSPDGLRVVTSDRTGDLTMWSTETGERLATHARSSLSAYYAQFSNNGLWVVTAGADPAAALLDSRFGIEVQDGGIDSEPVQGSGFAAEFSPDDTRVVLALASGEAAVIDISMIPREDLFAMACRRLGSDTSLDDLRARYRLGQIGRICGDGDAGTLPAALDLARLR